jgi:hypothetical protein
MGEILVIWPNLADPEGGARFVLDNHTEAYLWKGLEETGHARMKAINQGAELVGWDFSNFTRV